MRQTGIKLTAWVLSVCLAHNSVAAFYWAAGTLFFAPYPAIADVVAEESLKGRSLGQAMRDGFVLPDADPDTGTLTLKNGAVAGETVGQGELFQEIEPGSMDAAVAAYGNNEAMAGHVNGKLDELGSSATGHGLGYQTLTGANTALTNLGDDPLWKTSDDVFGQKTADISEKFSGCQKTVATQDTACTIHTPKVKTCKKTAKAEVCRVKRQVNIADDAVTLFSMDGAGTVRNTLLDEVEIQIGKPDLDAYGGDRECLSRTDTMTVDVKDESRLVKTYLSYAAADDNVKLTIDGNTVLDTGTCTNVDEWQKPLNVDVSGHFKNGRHELKLHTYSKVSKLYGGWVTITSRQKLANEFTDTPAGCRERLADAWPPSGTPPNWTITDSPEDRASTPWWQCTDADDKRTFGTVTVDSSVPLTFRAFHDILPDPPGSPPAPICYSAETRPPGHVALPCFTDMDGYQQCPEFDYDMEAHDTCGDFEGNAACAYLGEQCADNAKNPVTGACQEFVVSYDCGTDTPASCGTVKTEDKSVCDSDIRCIGGECVDHGAESSGDFTRVAAAMQTLNQAQQENGCDPSQGECKLFEGETLSCQMADLSILGKVDCCNMPIEGSWMDYLNLGVQTWELADTSVDAYALAEYGAEAVNSSGAWTLALKGTAFADAFGAVKDAYTAVTEPFTSMFDSVSSMIGEKIGTQIGLEAMKNTVMNNIGQWVSQKLGTAVAQTLFSYTTQGTGQAAVTTFTGLSSSLSTMFTVVGLVYAVYNIAKLVVQMIFACTEEEASLNMMKDQRLCTRPDEIGTYCSADMMGICLARREAYCCFPSAFGRIFQQQARPQLGLDFGPPKNPECGGLTREQMGKLDFGKMDFQEWIGMLQITGHMPLDGSSADVMYGKDSVTRSKLNPDGENTRERLKTQTEDADMEGIRQRLLDNL
jgi:conjugal transfer mating pair stabilization protein TraN